MLYNTGCSRISHLMGSTNGIVIYSMQLVLAWSLASAVMLVASGAPPPSTTSLAHCPKTCGSVSIWYPFGIGPGCFREGFELTCSNNTKPWKLFLGNTTTQVTSLFPSGTVLASVMYTIPMTPGVGTYNLSWDSPGRNLNIETYNYLAFLGCGIGVYLFHPDTGDLLGHCTSKCASMSAMLMATEGGICNGMGCCTVTFPVLFRGFRVTIIKNNETVPQPFANLTIKAFLTFYPYRFSVADLLSDKINASTVGASSAYLSTVITDEPNCASARLDNKTRYACGSSNCVDVENGGYSCTCSGNSDNGSPYLLDGCKQEYNPTPKMNCSRSCGTTSIPFPFGLEPGCFAKRRFQLNCVSNRTLIGRPPAKYEVTNISLVEGLLYVNKLSEFEDANTKFLSVYYGGGSGYFGQQLIYGLEKSVSSEEYGVWGWSVTNLTCENAKRKSEYACLSTNSECLGVTRGGLYIGYRCKCSVGFEGNPYVQNGCTDIDECRIPNYCNGTCYNLKGSYSCCPHGMSFDPVRRQCTSNKRQSLLLGVAIGISSGFGVLVLTLSAIVLVKRWKRGTQKKIRRAYFRKNKGLLLEQLISSSESVTHNTRIFSLEELEKATNNFDSTRILGHGGHGTVYKGILSDQRVVAIKKSKIVEQSEINQFVNEVAILSQIIHRNVVKLFGCCLESEVPLLVYEFISNGTLHDLLHGDLSAKCLLTWDDRIRIALEGSGALAYLHSSAAMPIFHRDVKSTNILMDGTFTTKVSDFGASRSISIDQTRVVTAVQGTFGYLDPEYYYTGQLTEKSDVYSFGVILVELLTRKKPIFLNCLGEKQNLCHCFLRGLRDNTVMDIVDAQVVEEASQTEIDEIASVAEMCLRTKGEKRPKMKEVELRLQLLRARRSRIYKEELQRDSETKPLLTPKSKSTSLTVTKNVEFGLVANPASQAVSRCYTIEREIASSAEFPR